MKFMSVMGGLVSGAIISVLVSPVEWFPYVPDRENHCVICYENIPRTIYASITK